MTDSTPTPPTPEPVTPPAAPAYAAAPGPKQTTSLIGFILGLVAFVFSWTAIVGIGAGIAAIIVSRRGKKTEPGAPNWMHIIALVGGIVGIVIGAIVLIFWVIGLVALAALGSYSYTG
jgi:hypothetical protein